MKPPIRYPFQDTVTPCLEGERWKDVAGFGGGFQVSDMGRVKSLDRVVPHSRCGSQFVKGRILRQNIKKHYNKFTDDYILIPQVTLMLENRRHEYSVRRLVYGTFVNPSVLRSGRDAVVSIDGDGLNCRLDNLRLVNKSEHMSLVFQRGRAVSCLADIDRRTFKPTFALWKPVHRCDQEGRVLETYPSIASTAGELGFMKKGIADAAKSGKSYNGHKWQFAEREVLKPLMEAYLPKNRKRLRKPLVSSHGI